jgi:hypothetical protein
MCAGGGSAAQAAVDPGGTDRRPAQVSAARLGEQKRHRRVQVVERRCGQTAEADDSAIGKETSLLAAATISHSKSAAALCHSAAGESLTLLAFQIICQ